MTQPTWREAGTYAVITFLFVAAFPGLASRLRWPTRLGPRSFIAYVAFNTAFGFALRTWGLPYLKRLFEERERIEEQLREQLGRQPTEDEMLAHFRVDPAGR